MWWWSPSRGSRRPRQGQDPRCQWHPRGWLSRFLGTERRWSSRGRPGPVSCSGSQTVIWTCAGIQGTTRPSCGSTWRARRRIWTGSPSLRSCSFTSTVRSISTRFQGRTRRGRRTPRSRSWTWTRGARREGPFIRSRCGRPRATCGMSAKARWPSRRSPGSSCDRTPCMLPLCGDRSGEPRGGS